MEGEGLLGGGSASSPELAFACEGKGWIMYIVYLSNFDHSDMPTAKYIHTYLHITLEYLVGALLQGFGHTRKHERECGWIEFKQSCDSLLAGATDLCTLRLHGEG